MLIPQQTEHLISPPLIASILAGYELDLNGIHGIAHWGRVLENGLRLADSNGADPVVVTYFALFHDARRVNDHRDHGHGKRGAQLFLELLPHVSVSTDQKDQIVRACTHHTDGTTEESLAVQTCWDSDRLDLWRVGTSPRSALLCTSAAKEQDILDWSRIRSSNHHFPDCSQEWLRLIEGEKHI